MALIVICRLFAHERLGVAPFVGAATKFRILGTALVLGTTLVDRGVFIGRAANLS